MTGSAPDPGSVFRPAEMAYLQAQTMGRLATIVRDGRPHLTPVTYRFNQELDCVDIGGVDFAATKKWRDAVHNHRVAFLVDDASTTGAHAVEVRADAEIHRTGGETINPRFPNFVPEFLRLRPVRIISWGLEGVGFEPIGRNVR
jgi:pyridoxamine 5'-phosphate oxidase family protein